MDWKDGVPLWVHDFYPAWIFMAAVNLSCFLEQSIEDKLAISYIAYDLFHN